MRVRGQKRERPLGVALVLGQMKGHAAKQMPQRIDATEPGRRSLGKLGRLGRCQFSELVPERSQQPGGQILEPAHRRGFGRQQGKFFFRRRGD